MREKQWGDIAFYFAFVMWMAVALIKYTYFKDLLSISKISDPVMYLVLFLCTIKIYTDLDRQFNQIILLSVFLLLVMIALKNDKLQFAAMFALIYSARTVIFRQICKLSLILQISLFVSTVLASYTPLIEDVVWSEANRNRHALGFTHCMLASHFGLFIPILWVCYRKKMELASAVIFSLFNLWLYKMTVGRTDFILGILFIISAFLVSQIKDPKIFKSKIFCILTSSLPFFFISGSILITWLYNENNATWFRINQILTSRLYYGKEAIKNYGFRWFGQKITFVGMSTMYYRPNAIYNYVDNAYINMMLIYGNLFIICYCIASSYILYYFSMKQNLLIVLCFITTMVFGIINPQSMYLTYNPLLILLSAVIYQQFTRTKRSSHEKVSI